MNISISTPNLSLLPKRLLLSLTVIVLAFFSSAANAQSEPFDDEPPEYMPGLIADYQSPTGRAQRVDHDISFAWGDAAPDTRLQPGSDFSATWNGYLQVKENGSFQLSLFACGQVTVTLGGEQVLSAQAAEPQWLQCAARELQFGRHELQIEFRKTHPAARLGLYWSGPSFALEPVSPSFLLHATEESPDHSYQLGASLSRGLRCAACHETAVPGEPLAAPSLAHLQDNLRPSWLLNRLTSQADGSLTSSRMPHFGLAEQDAAAITAALLAASDKPKVPQAIEPQLEAAKQRRGKKGASLRTTADPQQGQMTFAAQGCTACHQLGSLGPAQELDAQLFAGGDLSQLAAKRTENFLHRWLVDPAQCNPQHRMPKFELSLLERLDLVTYLAGQGEAGADATEMVAAADARRGARLIAEHR
ncbi:MAG: c-type cytochrome, partial [Planctomycetales bacterium]|nr:c-type cytochrome [Planctomycetales bacterium]